MAKVVLGGLGALLIFAPHTLPIALGLILACAVAVAIYCIIIS